MVNWAKVSSLEFHISKCLWGSDIDSSVKFSTTTDCCSIWVTILSSKLIVDLPVHINGILDHTCTVGTAIITALLSVNWMMSGAGRSDDTGWLSSVWHVDAHLLVAIGRTPWWLIVRADLNLLSLLWALVDWLLAVLARATSSKESLWWGNCVWSVASTNRATFTVIVTCDDVCSWYVGSAGSCENDESLHMNYIFINWILNYYFIIIYH